MALIDVVADVVGGAGGALKRLGDALRTGGPRAVASGNPSVTPPTVEGLPTGARPFPPQVRENRKLQEALETVEAYFGRVSTDAGPTMTRFSSYPATDLTPEKIAGAQQEAVAGWPLRWEEMIEQVLARDSHLSGIAQQRVDDVIKGSWRLMSALEDPVAVALRNFCDEGVRGIDEFEDGLGWLLWSNAYCYNVDEVVWKRDRITFQGPKGEKLGPIDVILPTQLAPVHPKHFRFDMRTDEPRLWLGGDNNVAMPYGKFIFLRGEGQHPITERRGYMWPCVWLSMFRSIGWAGWVTFVNRFGMPVPLIEYDGSVAQYSEYKQAYQDILSNLGTGQGAIYPSSGARFRIEAPPQGGRSSDPHSALSDACDAAQSVRVLGATLTAKIGNVGSFAASETHVEVKYAREESDARRLWAALRSQLIAPMVRINAAAISDALRRAGYGRVGAEEMMRRVPRGLHRVPRETDPVARMGVVTSAVGIGMRVSHEGIAYELDLPEPKRPDDVIPGEPQQVTSGGKVVGAVEAATEGAEAPKEEKPADSKQPGSPPALAKKES